MFEVVKKTSVSKFRQSQLFEVAFLSLFLAWNSFGILCAAFIVEFANIWLFKVTNRNTRKRCEILGSMLLTLNIFQTRF